ncbi:MAG: hypothetical protein RMK18_07955 [Armatimonadota bacterium]|nr:hypothetical protein [Armatimonadota bacterium]MDW8025778.1 hypothetical protein [Armatimonadota bacterium]
MRTMNFMGHSDAHPIRARLVTLIRLYQLLAFTCVQLLSWSAFAICLAIAILVAMLILHCGDYMPDALILAIGLLLLLQLAACAAVKVIPSAFRWLSPLKVAIELEHQFESLKGKVTCGVELSMQRVLSEGISERLVQAAIADALNGMLSVRWHLPLLRRANAAAKVTAVALILWLAIPLWMKFSHINPYDLMMPFIAAYGSIAFARHGKLVIEPLPKAVLRGSNLMVRVRVTGGVPKDVWLKVTGINTKRITHLRMHTDVRPSHLFQLDSLIRRKWRNLTFETLLHNLQEDVLVSARSGNVRSKALLINVVDFPKVKSIRFSVEPPPYTGLEPNELSPKAADKLPIPYGSFVTIVARCNNKLKNATISCGNGSQAPMHVHGNAASTSFEVRRNMRISMMLHDVYGFESQWGRVLLSVVQDKPPMVRILTPTENEVRVLPVASVPVVVGAADDYGLRKLKVVFVGDVTDEREVELGSYSFEREATANLLMHIVGLRVGSIIRFRALAYDNDELLGPKVGYSDWRAVRVVTIGEFLSEFEGLERRIKEMLHNAAVEYKLAIKAIEGATKALEQRSLSESNISNMRTAIERLSELKSSIEQLGEELSSKVDMAHLNQIASPIDWLERLLHQFLIGKLSGDVESFKRLESAIRQQAKFDALSRMADSVRSSAQMTMEGINQAMMALRRAKRFSELFKLTLEAAKTSKLVSEISGQVERLSGKGLQSSQVFKSLTDVEKRIHWLSGRMKSIATEWRNDREEDLARILMNAYDKLPMDEIKLALTNAHNAVRNNDLSKAAVSISALHQAAQKFSDVTLEAYELARLWAYRSDRDKLAQVWGQVMKLLKRQREIAALTAKLLEAARNGNLRRGEYEQGGDAQLNQSSEISIPTIEELTKRQESLTESAQSLPGHVSELLRLVPQIDARISGNAKSALREMKSSSILLRMRNLPSASRAQRNATAALEMLSSALSNVFHYSYGVASQLAGIAQMEMLELACLQESINLQSEGWVRLKAAHGEAQRKLMAVQEKMIRSALKRADNLFGVPWSAELRELVHMAQTDANEVALAIEGGSIDPSVRKKQERILLTLLRLANELSGTPQAMQMMQRLAQEREGDGMKAHGRKEGEKEDGGREGNWKDWLRSLPDSLFGRFIEHGPPMKSIPEALVLRHAQATQSLIKGEFKGSTQPMPYNPEVVPPAPYRNAITIYFKRVGNR